MSELERAEAALARLRPGVSDPTGDVATPARLAGEPPLAAAGD
jgi:hypothetical protein